MEIGSKEHKQALKQSIYKIAIKTILVSLGIAIFFSIPSFVRENDFSLGLALFGQVALIIGVLYALVVAFNKYRQIILPFDEQYKK